MKISRLLVAAGLGLLAVAGCNKDEQKAESTVTVYMYSEYIDPDMQTEFEKLTGQKLKIDVYESSEEMLAKMQQAGGASQYDCIVVSDAHVPTLISLNLVKPLDMSKISNAGNVAEKFRNPPFDPESKYSLPYQWGTVGLVYDKTKVQGEISWDLIFDPAKQPGSFVLIDSMRDMLGVALRYNGFSMNSVNPEELKKAMQTVMAAKRSSKCLGLEGGVGGKNRVASGEAVLAIAYNGDAVRAVAENSNLEYKVPSEGGVIWVDVMMVPAKAPNPDGGHAFINYILDPAAGAKLSNYNRYATPNQASMPMINEEDRTNPAVYPPQEIMEKLEYLVDVGENTRLYDEAWTNIKAQ